MGILFINLILMISVDHLRQRPTHGGVGVASGAKVVAAMGSGALTDRDGPTRPGRSIKMGLYLYINLKFNGLNTLFLSWGDRAAARYGPQDGPPVFGGSIPQSYI
jgi:hypothetical protein